MDWVADLLVFSVTSCEIVTQRSEANWQGYLDQVDTKTQMERFEFCWMKPQGMVTFINGAFSFMNPLLHRECKKKINKNKAWRKT